jgi:hypothetical protein
MHTVEREHRTTATKVDPGPLGALDQGAGIARAGHQTMEIAHPEPEVIGMAGNPAGVLFALVDGDVVDAEAAQLDGGRESGRTSTDDGDVAIDPAHGATLQRVSLHSSAWQ